MKITHLLLATCFSFALGAQNNPSSRNSLSLMYGIGKGDWKDQSYSPLRYDLGSMQSELRFQHITKKGNLWDFELQGWAALLSNTAGEEFETQLLGVDLKAAFLWELLNANGWSVYLGPQYKAGSQIITREDDYHLNYAFSYLSTSNIAASFRVNYQVNRWDFDVNASLPLIATNSRPAYSGFPGEDGEHILNYLFDYVRWQTPDEYFAPELTFTLGYDVFNWVAVAAKYEGSYTSLKDEKPIDFTTHQLMLGLNFKL